MKRLLSYLLSIVLLLSLYGCGSVTDGRGDETTAETVFETAGETKTEQPTDYNEPVDYKKPITKALVESIVNAEYRTPKNVIVIIGDGMGQNDIAIAEKYADGVQEFGLIMNMIIDNGLAATHSSDNKVTDSAASGTALSTGKKTDNGMIGRAPDGKDLQTLAELARASGKKVGIVTDDEIYGATPSAFVTHSNSRYNYDELSRGIASFAPDVLIGKKLSGFSDKLDTVARNVLRKEYNVCEGTDSFESILAKCKEEGKKFAGFNGGCREVMSDHLAVSAQTALEYLRNENGFFLLIEGAGTDIYGHANNMKGKLASVVNLDRAIGKVLLFMEKNPDTLLIITSDHETGGAKLPSAGEVPGDGLFTTTTHTSTNVRVFALGEGSSYFKDRTVDNTDIAKFVRSAVSGK